MRFFKGSQCKEGMRRERKERRCVSESEKRRGRRISEVSVRGVWKISVDGGFEPGVGGVGGCCSECYGEDGGWI